VLIYFSYPIHSPIGYFFGHDREMWEEYIVFVKESLKEAAGMLKLFINYDAMTT